MPRKKNKLNPETTTAVSGFPLSWLRAAYKFHTFAYRDPRSAFASAPGVPVVSPTTVLLGIASTLFSLGKGNEAKDFIGIAHICKVIIDAPNGVIFFRAFHQLRRYETDAVKEKKEKHKPNVRIGLTKINQGIREYGLVDGEITIYVGVTQEYLELVRLALLNLGHLGTHDSLCALAGNIEMCSEPADIVYLPIEKWQGKLEEGTTAVTLSRFKEELKPTLKHWWIAGGEDTEKVPYFIKGRFEGTTRGKIYHKY